MQRVRFAIGIIFDATSEVVRIGTIYPADVLFLEFLGHDDVGAV